MYVLHKETVFENVIYQSKKTYEELLESSDVVSTDQRHLWFLVNEVYKSTSYLSSKFMYFNFFTHTEIQYNRRKRQALSLPPTRSRYYLTNSLHFLGSLIWKSLPSYEKSSRSVCEFKNIIKNFRDIDCGCLICQISIWRCNGMHSCLFLLVLFLFSLLIYSMVGFY